jgi:glycosyltransferase involved in cell wall biosynthesis
MKITIITPTLGVSNYLGETIQSVRWHRGNANWVIDHVIVGPVKYMSCFAKAYPECRFVPETGRGLYSALNDGLAAINGGDYWTYLNDDDVLTPAFSAVLENAGSNSIIYGSVALLNHASVDIGLVTRLRFPYWMKAALAGKRSPLNQQGAILPVSTLVEVGFFDATLKYAADYDYFCRAAQLRYKFKFIDETVAGFRINPGQLSSNTGGFVEEINRVRVRYRSSYFMCVITSLLFFVGNVGVYINRLLKRRPSGLNVFKV